MEKQRFAQEAEEWIEIPVGDDEGLRALALQSRREHPEWYAEDFPLQLGGSVYFVLEDADFGEDPFFIDTGTVTAIGRQGFWVSSFFPPREDAGLYTPWKELDRGAFPDRAGAEKEVQRRRERK